MSPAKPTDAQRAGNSASFKRATATRAQIAARRKWVADTEMDAEELAAIKPRLRAASRIAREMLGERAA